MSADQHERVHLGRINWQHMLVVLEQHDAFFRHTLCESRTRFHIGHLLCHRMIEQSLRKDCSQDPMHMIIQLILGHFSALDCFLQRIAEEVLVGLLLVEPCMRRLRR
jgi:hypothetical protein